MKYSTNKDAFLNNKLVLALIFFSDFYPYRKCIRDVQNGQTIFKQYYFKFSKQYAIDANICENQKMIIVYRRKTNQYCQKFMDQQKNELYETALFRKFKECLEKEKELQIYNKTHIDKFYKAMPCTIGPRKIKNCPIIMAQMLTKKIVYREEYSQIEIQESNRSRLFSRIQSPSRNEDRQYQMRSLMLSRREKERCSSVKSDVFDQANIQLNQYISNVPKKLRIPKYKKAELYFCSHLRDRLRTPRLGITIPQYLATKIKSIK